MGMQEILGKILFFRVPEKGRFSPKYARRAVLASPVTRLYLRRGKEKKLLPDRAEGARRATRGAALRA